MPATKPTKAASAAKLSTPGACHTPNQRLAQLKADLL